MTKRRPFGRPRVSFAQKLPSCPEYPSILITMRPSIFKRPNPVTLIIGIKCKDAIVLASDSQMTTGNSKRTDGSKLERVDFKDFPAMVAQSGDQVLSNRFIDILTGLAVSAPIKTPEDVGLVIQAAMRNLRTELHELHFGCSSEELSEIFRKEGTSVGVMVGFFLDKTPQLISISLASPTYRKSRYYFEADGCGATLGEYLLAEHSTPEMDKQLAATVAVYVVELVKRYDAYCGGPTNVGVLQDYFDVGPSIGIYHQAAINRCAERVLEISEAGKPERLKMFQEQAKARGFAPAHTVFSDEPIME